LSESSASFLAGKCRSLTLQTVASSSTTAEFHCRRKYLGRGLTIDNLLVTYYLRRAKVSQMDTVLQHARMFGYRRALMPYTRVFLPDSLGARFHFIHVAERNLRRQLAEIGGQGKILVETMSALRATRLNVLDTQNLAAYEAGEQIYPGAASFERRDLKRGSGNRSSGAIYQVALQEGAFISVELWPDLSPADRALCKQICGSRTADPDAEADVGSLRRIGLPLLPNVQRTGVSTDRRPVRRRVESGTKQVSTRYLCVSRRPKPQN
jgi:hypothetical protein